MSPAADLELQACPWGVTPAHASPALAWLWYLLPPDPAGASASSWAPAQFELRLGGGRGAIL